MMLAIMVMLFAIKQLYSSRFHQQIYVFKAEHSSFLRPSCSGYGSKV